MKTQLQSRLLNENAHPISHNQSSWYNTFADINKYADKRILNLVTQFTVLIDSWNSEIHFDQMLQQILSTFALARVQKGAYQYSDNGSVVFRVRRYNR